ncbi:toxin [Rhodococcus sp. SJ-3]|uniref:toxin n=1 Tax=Rhodococcus sp. SJ-3 TaxID=3454628 RepID=UPI003F794C3C
MKAHKSAFEHGIDGVDSLHAAQHHVYAADLVVLRFDSRNELLIHAMKARPQYFDLLP